MTKKARGGQVEKTFVDTRDGKTYPRFVFSREDDNRIIPTPEWRGFQSHLLTQSIIKKSNCPTRAFTFEDYRGADVNGNVAKLKQYADGWVGKFSRVSLYMWSLENSTQKTSMAAALLIELVRRHGIDAYFIGMNDLIENLMQWKRGGDNYLPTKVPFLVIDDCFDITKVTLYKSGFQLSIIDTFLRDRLDYHHRATVFTSNVPIAPLPGRAGKIAGIEEGFGASLKTLVERNAVPMHFTDVFVPQLQGVWDD
jgi:hypothetical protein